MRWAHINTLKQGGRKVKKESTLTSSSHNKQNLIALNYGGKGIILNEDGWFNATKASESFSKNLNEWLRLPRTQEYLNALERKYGKILYLKTKNSTQEYIATLCDILRSEKSSLPTVKRGGRRRNV